MYHRAFRQFAYTSLTSAAPAAPWHHQVYRYMNRGLFERDKMMFKHCPSAVRATVVRHEDIVACSSVLHS